MSRSNDPVPVETRLQLVLAVLAHEVTAAEAALGVRRPGPFGDLEALRAAAQLPVARFAALAGIPERTYRRRLAMLRSGNDTIKGPWPTGG